MLRNMFAVGIGVMFVFLTYIRKADGAGAFLTPGVPVCYSDASQYQGVPSLYNRCSFTCDGYYLYCSNDHDCCTHGGCPACCPKRSYLYQGEVAGIVISCVVFVAISFGAAIAITAKFCTKNKNA